MSLGKLFGGILTGSFCRCSLKQIKHDAKVKTCRKRAWYYVITISVIRRHMSSFGFSRLASPTGPLASPTGRPQFYSCSNTSFQRSWCVRSSHLLGPGAERQHARLQRLGKDLMLTWGVPMKNMWTKCSLLTFTVMDYTAQAIFKT